MTSNMERYAWAEGDLTVERAPAVDPATAARGISEPSVLVGLLDRYLDGGLNLTQLRGALSAADQRKTLAVEELRRALTAHRATIAYASKRHPLGASVVVFCRCGQFEHREVYAAHARVDDQDEDERAECAAMLLHEKHVAEALSQ